MSGPTPHRDAARPVAVAVLDTDSTIRLANKSFRAFTELSERAVVGRSLPELLQTRWGVTGLEEKLNELASAPAGTTLEFSHRPASSDGKALRIQAQALATDGGAATLRFAVAVLPVPPLVEVTAPVVFVY